MTSNLFDSGVRLIDGTKLGIEISKQTKQALRKYKIFVTTQLLSKYIKDC